FVNGGGWDWWNVSALSQDGEFLAGHACSHPSFGPRDMGCLDACDWKHEFYRERYPDGYEVVWVEDARTDENVKAAYAKHVESAPQGTEWERARKADLDDAIELELEAGDG